MKQNTSSDKKFPMNHALSNQISQRLIASETITELSTGKKGCPLLLRCAQDAPWMSELLFASPQYRLILRTHLTFEHLARNIAGKGIHDNDIV